MRVLQVINSLYWGGVQELQVTLATAAQKSGISLSLASLGADEDTPYRARLERLGVPVRTFPARKLYDSKRILALSGFMRRESFDLVHTHLSSSNIVGAFAARTAGIPLIATLHVPNIDGNALRKRLNVWVLRNLMDSVTAIGPTIAETYPHNLKRKPIRVIPNAVYLPPEFPAEERLKIRCEIIGGADGPVIISAGRLDQFKGFEDLLNGIAHLRRAYPSLCLLIAGAGSLYSALQAQIQVQDLTRQVHLLGGRGDVPRLLAASDIYVSASYSEGMSISILEAMAAGLPVVATCAGENSRLVLPSTGILIPVGDPQALAAGIARLIDSPKLRSSLGAEGRCQVSRLYNVETWFDRIRSLYEEILERHP
jgi:glycosyltransferase involved in cell wall biosynthesis